MELDIFLLEPTFWQLNLHFMSIFAYHIISKSVLGLLYCQKPRTQSRVPSTTCEWITLRNTQSSILAINKDKNGYCIISVVVENNKMITGAIKDLTGTIECI